MTYTATEKTAVGNGDTLAGLVLEYHQRAHTSEFVFECPEEMCVTAQQITEWDALLGIGA